jgi:hypothetical protein
MMIAAERLTFDPMTAIARAMMTAPFAAGMYYAPLT